MLSVEFKDHIYKNISPPLNYFLVQFTKEIIENEEYMNMLKYHPLLTTTNWIVIDINVLYPGIEEDLYHIISNREILIYIDLNFKIESINLNSLSIEETVIKNHDLYLRINNILSIFFKYLLDYKSRNIYKYYDKIFFG